MSGGRARLGIGAAWNEHEHLGLGVPFPATSERYERLDETLAICRQMWSDDDGPFDGTHFQLTETLNSPQNVSSPAPEVMVGGMGVITPPVGINVYVVAGIARDVPLHIIFKGSAYLMCAMIILSALLIIFPQIALWLPGLMG